MLLTPMQHYVFKVNKNSFTFVSAANHPIQQRNGNNHWMPTIDKCTEIKNFNGKSSAFPKSISNPQDMYELQNKLIIEPAMPNT